jgi:hypothetical protein
MFISGTISKRESYGNLLSFTALACGSLLFGMMTVFEWGVLRHGGIGIVFAIAIIGFLAPALAERQARKRTEVASKPR